MCGWFGGNDNDYSPPPSPEEVYRNQIGQFTRNKEALYGQQAHQWNSSVNQYQSQLNDYKITGNDYYNQASNLTMQDADGISTLRDKIQSDYRNFNNLSFDAQRPEFQTYFNGFNHNGQYIPASASVTAPTLTMAPSSYNQQKAGQGFTSALDHLDNLEKQRTTEQNRINQFQSGMRNTANSYASTLSNLDISNLNGINKLEQQINYSLDDLNNFNSVLDTDFSRSTSMFNDTLAGINSLKQQRTDEQNRINTFQNEINTLASQYGDSFSGLGITDADQIRTLNSDIEAAMGKVSGFNSLLSPDLSAQFNSLSDLNKQVDELQQARDLELSRINSTEQGALGSADIINQIVSGGDYYNLNSMTGLQTQLDSAREKLSGFTSELDYDFTDELAALDATQGSIDALNNQRQSTLDNLVNARTDLSQQLSAAQLYDEALLRQIQNQARSGQGQANLFIGGRAGDVQGGYNTLLSDANSRIEELLGKRNTIEEQAQALQTQLGDTTFLDLDQLSGLEEQFNTIKGDQELYNSQQALDEVSAMAKLFGSERTRLEADAQAAAQAQLAGEMEIKNRMNENGDVLLPDLSFRDPQTFEEWQRYLSSQEEEDEINGLASSSFANSLIYL